AAFGRRLLAGHGLLDLGGLLVADLLARGLARRAPAPSERKPTGWRRIISPSSARRTEQESAQEQPTQTHEPILDPDSPEWARFSSVRRASLDDRDHHAQAWCPCAWHP